MYGALAIQLGADIGQTPCCHLASLKCCGSTTEQTEHWTALLLLVQLLFVACRILFGLQIGERVAAQMEQCKTWWDEQLAAKMQQEQEKQQDKAELAATIRCEVNTWQWRCGDGGLLGVCGSCVAASGRLHTMTGLMSEIAVGMFVSMARVYTGPFAMGCALQFEAACVKHGFFSFLSTLLPVNPAAIGASTPCSARWLGRRPQHVLSWPGRLLQPMQSSGSCRQQR